MDQSRYCSCPFCDAIFRLTSAKLKQAFGMVRCGACRNVFDAYSRLLVETETGLAPFESRSLAEFPKINGATNQKPQEVTVPALVYTERVSEWDIGNSDNEADYQSIKQSFDELDRTSEVTLETSDMGDDTALLMAIEPYMKSGQSGTAMIVFRDNSLGRIYLDSGIPIAARYRISEGDEAFKICESLDVLTVKFHENTDIVKSSISLESMR